MQPEGQSQRMRAAIYTGAPIILLSLHTRGDLNIAQKEAISKKLTYTLGVRRTN